MSAAQVVTLLATMIAGTLFAAPDFDWAMGALGWSVLGFLVGIGAGYLLWGRKDTP